MFWAVLPPRQSWRYYGKHDDDQPGVLLVTCPEQRIGLLWDAVGEQPLDPERSVEHGPLSRSPGLWRASAQGSPPRVITLSWELLLVRLQAATEEFAIQADIHQLRSLVERINGEAFPPLTPEIAAPGFQARDTHLRRMVRDLAVRGRREG